MVVFMSGNQNMHSTPEAISSLPYWLYGSNGSNGCSGLDSDSNKSLINQECLPELPVKVFHMKEQE